MIRLTAPETWDPVDAALDRMADYDALALSSANAVRFLAHRADQRGVALAVPSLRVFCVGPHTAAAARQAGLPVHHVPPERHDARALLAEIVEKYPPAGRRFLFPCGDRARDVLPAGLVADGAEVDVVTVYRTVPPDLNTQAVRGLLLDLPLDALTFTSPSAVVNFASLLDDDSRAAAKRCIVAAIGPLTAEALREVGLGPDVTTGRAGVVELVEALGAHGVARAPGGSR
jgi:uroporphyrinogen III methyltransferase/synthase